ncbi:hypothetical protein H5410_017838 [Solanum commersonii]|uniref:Uncharacterized protein n=1 Tax=Solanum commersonii TaxID=4109 RepID=A0A9J6A077_SOLCO|nr:hypothetical protein H5410_017838 [Solanum commersonii]
MIDLSSKTKVKKLEEKSLKEQNLQQVRRKKIHENGGDDETNGIENLEQLRDIINEDDKDMLGC